MFVLRYATDLNSGGICFKIKRYRVQIQEVFRLKFTGCRVLIQLVTGSNPDVGFKCMCQAQNSCGVGFKFGRCRVKIQEVSGSNSGGVRLKFTGCMFQLQGLSGSNSASVGFKFRRC